MNECSVNEILPPVSVGMALTDSLGTHMTGLVGLTQAFAPCNDHIVFSAAEENSSRKRRLEKEMILEQQETDENILVSEMVTSPRGTCLSHGFASVIGRRSEMEDTMAIELGFLTIDNSRDYDFFGVYDGHGGARVANSCQERLHHLLAEECKTKSESCFGKEVWSKVMLDCFLKMDGEVMIKGGNLVTVPSKTEAQSPTIGSTAVVAVVGEDEVVIANCGDSRAVLCRGGIPISITNDHKPDRADELERIESVGGKVIDWDGQRVFGVLATSRSIGDEYLKLYVIAEPEVILSKRSSEEDEFFILATDGLWDVVTNEMACLMVKRCLEGRSLKKRRRSVSTVVQEDESIKVECVENKNKNKKRTNYGRASAAAGMLVDLAISRGSKDNITVVVVDLNKARKQRAKAKANLVI